MCMHKVRRQPKLLTSWRAAKNIYTIVKTTSKKFRMARNPVWLQGRARVTVRGHVCEFLTFIFS